MKSPTRSPEEPYILVGVPSHYQRLIFWEIGGTSDQPILHCGSTVKNFFPCSSKQQGLLRGSRPPAGRPESSSISTDEPQKLQDKR